MAANAQLPALPGMITKIQDFKLLAGTFQKMEDRISRLRVQACVLVILGLLGDLENAVGPGQLEIEEDGDGQEFSQFAFSPDDDEDEAGYGSAADRQARLLGDAGGMMHSLKLNVEQFQAFLMASPFMFQQAEAQLRSAYETALSPVQREGKGAWEIFWGSIRPRA